MKITKVERFVTAVPHIPSIEQSRPGDFRERPITILRVHTDDGIIGIGEGGRGDLMEDVESQWLGVDPLNLNLTTMGGAVAMACFDIVGKAFGVPAHRLMGSKHWEQVPVGW